MKCPSHDAGSVPPILIMSPSTLFFILRLGLAGLLYAFLGVLLWMLWQDTRQAAQTSASRSRQAGRLIVLESTLPRLAEGATFPLLPVTALGRAPTNTVVIPDEAASLEHALLHFRDNQWRVEDLGSRNGTRLNGAPVTRPTLVVAGDLLEIGHVKLKVEIE